MQGTSNRPFLERLRLPGMLALGLAVGALALAVSLYVIQGLVPAVGGPWVFIAGSLLLIAGDIRSIHRNRLFLLSVRRQAKQALVIRWRRMDLVAFTWGLDAGLGLGTYRVTSGLWLMVLAVLTLGTSAWWIALSGIAFSVSLLAFAWWPAKLTESASFDQQLDTRVAALMHRRQLVQGAYVSIALAVVALSLRS